jgi:hypothetical protein
VSLLEIVVERIVMAEVRGELENPEERERPPLEAVTRRFARTQQTGKT